MNVRERLRAMADVLPESGSVTLTRADLYEIAQTDDTGSEKAMQADFTVAQVADMFDRKSQTIRDWINAGRLCGYLFNDREYRITRGALEEFQEWQRNGATTTRQSEISDLGAWRQEAQKD